MSEWEAIFKAPKPLELYVMHTGYVHMNGNIHFNKKSPRFRSMPKDERFNPVLSFLLKHPEQGYLLLDTGLHGSFAEKSRGNFGFLLGTMVKAKAEPKRDVISQLNSIGIDPHDVRRIVLSHLHLDHPSALTGFRNVQGLTVHVDPAELEVLKSPFCMFKGYIKSHLKGLDIRPIRYDRSILPFQSVWDMFGDGSVLVMATPGHTPGHVSVLANVLGGPILLTCDAAHRRANMEEDIPPIGNYPRSLTTLETIRSFLAQHPHVRVIFSHDPDQLKQLKLLPDHYT